MLEIFSNNALKLITFVHKFLFNCQKGVKDISLLYPSKLLEKYLFLKVSLKAYVIAKNVCKLENVPI